MKIYEIVNRDDERKHLRFNQIVLEGDLDSIGQYTANRFATLSPYPSYLRFSAHNAAMDIVNYSTFINEAVNQDVKAFIDRINLSGIQLDQVEEGQKISMLSFYTWMPPKRFAVEGYVEPKTVVDIKHTINGIILQFEDGYEYPKYAHPVYEGSNPINTAIFTSAESLISEYGFLLLAKPVGWTVDLGGVVGAEKLQSPSDEGNIK